MPKYDKSILSEQADKLNFIRDTFEKVYRLANILKYFAINPKLSDSLALKGGTAINLTIFNLPRLSVDIDLDYTFNNTRDEMLKERETITENIKRYMFAEGYKLSSKSRLYHSLDSFVFTYTNSVGTKDNIKIEINYSLRCHILPLVNKPIKTLGVFSETNVLSLSYVEIFASKIVALISRVAARDLYDINNMILYDLFDESQKETLRKCVVFYGAINNIGFFNIDIINSIKWKKIKTDLLPVIRKREQFNLDGSKEIVFQYLTELLTLTPDEQIFLDAFQAGRYIPELLLDGEMLDRIKFHPMALWQTRGLN